MTAEYLSSLPKLETNNDESELMQEIHIPAGSLVLMVGLPGSGKSTFAHEHFPDPSVLSSDQLRQQLTNNPGNLDISDAVFRIMSNIAKTRLAGGATTVIDAMNISQKARGVFTTLAQELNCPVQVFFFEIPMDTVLQQDQNRPKPVGREHITPKLPQFEQARRDLSADPAATIHQVTPENRDTLRIKLSPEEEAQKQSEQAEQVFGQSAHYAEQSLMTYIEERMAREQAAQTDTENTVSVPAGSTTVLDASCRGFLEQNVLPQQVVDVAWIARRLGVPVEDPQVYNLTATILKTRQELNLTTFVVLPSPNVNTVDTGEEQEVLPDWLHPFSESNEVLRGIPETAFLHIARDEPEGPPLLVLGDIHGCATALRAHERNVFRENLAIGASEQKRRILAVGDIADRGPHSAEAVIFFSALVRNREAVLVKGNHDVNLQKGLERILAHFYEATNGMENATQETWQEWIATYSVDALSPHVLSADTRQTIQSLLQKSTESGGVQARLHLDSVQKILEVLQNAPTVARYRHLAAVHAVLPALPRSGEPLSKDQQKIHTHGIKNDSAPWRGRPAQKENIDVTAHDPDVLVLSGHTHHGVAKHVLAGTINLDYDGGNKGKIAGYRWKGAGHGQIVYESEPEMERLYAMLCTNELPTGPALLPFIRYIASQGMIDIKEGGAGSEYEGLMILNYTDITELQNLWDEYPVLRNFRGLIVDQEGTIVARPFQKTHKMGVEIPLDQMDSVYPNKVFEKANGSMGICYFHKGAWHIATKFSFHNAGFTVPAEQMLAQIDTSQFNPDNTYLFEIILANDPHIVDYGGQSKLILLNSISNQTGEAVPWDQMERIAEQSGAELVPDLTEKLGKMSIADLYRYAQTPGALPNMEGLMVVYTDPETGKDGTVKVKAVDYDKKKFVRDRLKWVYILERLDPQTGTLSDLDRARLLSYQADDPFVSRALDARLEWIRTTTDAITEELTIWIDLFIEEIKNRMGDEGAADHRTAMKVANEVVRDEGDIGVPHNVVMGLIRSRFQETEPSLNGSSAISSYVLDQLTARLEAETSARGKSAYWLVPQRGDVL